MDRGREARAHEDVRVTVPALRASGVREPSRLPAAAVAVREGALEPEDTLMANVGGPPSAHSSVPMTPVGIVRCSRTFWGPSG